MAKVLDFEARKRISETLKKVKKSIVTCIVCNSPVWNIWTTGELTCDECGEDILAVESPPEGA